MTQEELLRKQKEIEAEKQRQAKAAADAEYQRNKSLLGEDFSKQKTELAEEKNIAAGNIGYAGRIQQDQGAIADRWQGYGTSGAGIQRQNVRELATQSRLANLDTEYAKSQRSLTDAYNRNVSNVDFSQSQSNIRYENTLKNLEAEYELAIQENRFREAERVRQEYVVQQKAAQEKENAKQKALSDSIYEKFEWDNYTQAQRELMIANAQRELGLSDSAAAELLIKISDYSSLLAPSSSTVTKTPDFETRTNAADLSKTLDTLNQNRVKNTFSWINRNVVTAGEADNFLDRTVKGSGIGKTEPMPWDYMFKKMDNKNNFARDTMAIAGEIANMASSGKITLQDTINLLDKYRVAQDFGGLYKNGYLSSRQIEPILDKLAESGIYVDIDTGKNILVG